MEKKSGIYKITNTCNGKFYIGSSCDLKKRKGEHFRHLKGDYHDNSYLQNSYNKNGKENFKFEVIEYVENENNLLKREQHYLDILKPWDRKVGYNICKSAKSAMLGRKHSMATKIKIGLKSKDKIVSKETRAKLADKSRNRFKHLENMSELNKIKIINISTNKTFNSIKDASDYYGLDHSGVAKASKGILKTCGGYKWNYYKIEGVV